MDNESEYKPWIANRRNVEPSSDLTDRVMAAVEERELSLERHIRVVDRVNESALARWAACAAALLVGCLPFLLVAHVAKLLVF